MLRLCPFRTQRRPREAEVRAHLWPLKRPLQSHAYGLLAVDKVDTTSSAARGTREQDPSAGVQGMQGGTAHRVLRSVQFAAAPRSSSSSRAHSKKPRRAATCKAVSPRELQASQQAWTESRAAQLPCTRPSRRPSGTARTAHAHAPLLSPLCAGWREVVAACAWRRADAGEALWLVLRTSSPCRSRRRGSTLPLLKCVSVLHSVQRPSNARATSERRKCGGVPVVRGARRAEHRGIGCSGFRRRV